jgi:epoxyqueuosine reductase QueG
MKKNVENKLIKELAKEFEFNVCKITDAILPLSAALRLKEFIDSGFHGEMKWMDQ